MIALPNALGSSIVAPIAAGAALPTAIPPPIHERPVARAAPIYARPAAMPDVAAAASPVAALATIGHTMQNENTAANYQI